MLIYFYDIGYFRIYLDFNLENYKYFGRVVIFIKIKKKKEFVLLVCFLKRFLIIYN